MATKLLSLSVYQGQGAVVLSRTSPWGLAELHPCKASGTKEVSPAFAFYSTKSR